MSELKSSITYAGLYTITGDGLDVCKVFAALGKSVSYITNSFVPIMANGSNIRAFREYDASDTSEVVVFHDIEVPSSIDLRTKIVISCKRPTYDTVRLCKIPGFAKKFIDIIEVRSYQEQFGFNSQAEEKTFIALK